MDARIWITGAAGEPRSVSLARERTVVGRDPEADLPIEDEAVSWHHLEIENRADLGTPLADAPIGVGPDPGAVVVGAEAVWVANNGDGTVTRIEP
jgi:FHA domain